MITSNAASRTGALAGQAIGFEGVGGIAALLTAVAGFLYAVAFIILKNGGMSALFLLLIGLFSLIALVALYGRLRQVDESVALLGLLFSLAGAVGAMVHGGYDLANALHPPSSLPALPSAVDPRGLLTFGLAGLGLGVFAWLIGGERSLPARLGLLGYLTGLLLVVLYVARLVVLDASSPVVAIPAVLSGFVVNPAWYVWLGLTLLRGANRPRRSDHS